MWTDPDVNTRFIDIVDEQYHPGWEDWKRDNHDKLEHVGNIIDEKYKKEVIFPPKRDILRALSFVSPHAKALVLGMDPYPALGFKGIPQAHGMSFSSLDSVIPKSLQNIFKEIGDEYPEFKKPKSANLVNWARQGILLLNSALTVKEGTPGSHCNSFWIGVLHSLLNYIIEKNPGCIFILWGRKAEEVFDHCVSKENVITLRGAHPVAHGGQFFGNGHFLKVNEILVGQGKEPIDWNALNETE